jgi:hypothetical protein
VGVERSSIQSGGFVSVILDANPQICRGVSGFVTARSRLLRHAWTGHQRDAAVDVHRNKNGTAEDLKVRPFLVGGC